MWHHFFGIKKKLVTAVIEPSTISFSIFEFTHHSSLQKVFKKIPLSRAEIYEGKLFNFTFLRTILKSFLLENKAQNVFVALSMEGAAIKEKIFVLEENDSPGSIAQEIAPRNIWNFHFLSGDRQQIYFFSIARELSMQYQLLALLTPFNCCLMSTNTRALIELTTKYAQNSPATSIADYQQQGVDAFEKQTIFSHSLTQASGLEKKTIAIHTGLFLLGKHVLNENTK